VATNKGGKKRDTTNLKLRQKQWDALSADKQRVTKRPGSNKK
jgi:hypothetical protein